MKLSRTLAGAAVAALLVLSPTVAFAQDPDTGGVPQADADAACAAIADQETPAAEAVQAFRDAYNTTDNTDDGPASEGLTAEWQRVIYLQETHRDYLGMAGYVDVEQVPTFDCAGLTAEFPPLAPAPPTDLDCADFPLPDGRTAEDVLAEDESDPHGLDANGDGAPCEVDENEDPGTDPGADEQDDVGGQTPPPAPVEGGDAQANAGDVIVNVPGDYGQVGAADVPSGGVETGGGPAQP